MTRIFALTAVVAAVFLAFFSCTKQEDVPTCGEGEPACELPGGSGSGNGDGNGDGSGSGNGNGNGNGNGQGYSSSFRASSSSIKIEAGNYPKLVKGQSGVMTGWASRYWDGCKPSCSWSDKYQSISGLRCKNCDKDGYTELAAKDEVESSCDKNGANGSAYTCFKQIPIKINDTLAYAYAATPGNGQQCGKCYQIQFDGGFKHGTNGVGYATHAAIKNKTLIVMSSNIGGDVGEGQFDVLIPGGGVGLYNSISGQIGVSASQLGKQYGGFLSDCEESLNWSQGTLAQYQSCLKNKCKLFTNADLKAGCDFYADWAMAANNPTILYKEVTCPEYLVNNYKATKLN